MINGAHAIIYSTNAEADRAVFKNIFNLTHVDVGHGWVIFGLPPSELAVHPSESNDRHELYLMCENIEALVASLRSRGLTCTDVQNQGWGLVTQMTLPGGGRIGIYQPRHARPPSPALRRDLAEAQGAEAGPEPMSGSGV